MLLPELKNNQEGQWMLSNPPGASSDTGATFSASPGQVHLSFPWSQHPPGPTCCLICVLYYSVAPWRWEPELSPPESLLDWTQTGETLWKSHRAVTGPSPGVKRASEDFLEVAEATLVLTNVGGKQKRKGGNTGCNIVSRSELLPYPETNRTEVSHDTPKGSWAEQEP